MNTHKVVTTILDIIDFSENKEAFASEFILLSLKQAALKTLFNLPENQKKEIAIHINDVGNSAEFEKLSDEYFADIPDLELNIQSVFAQNIHDYIVNIIPELPLDKKMELIEYLQHLTLDLLH